MRKRILLVLVLIVLAAAAGVGARTALDHVSKNRRPGYTIVWQTTDYDADGKATPYCTETRYVSSSGRWRDLKQCVDGRNAETFGEVGRGVFVKRGQKLDFLSAYAKPAPFVTEEELRNSPTYLRSEAVLGYATIVVKAGNEVEDGSEFFRAPALGGDIIKTVFPSPDGRKTVREPVSLMLGEPDAKLLKMPDRDLPVDYKHYEEMHGPRQ